MTTAFFPISTSSYESFVQTASAIPILTPDEERDLFRRFQDDGDMEAGRQLIMSNLRFVIFIANGYTGYGFQNSELVQEGCVGLLKALKKFDLDRGVRFTSFAVHWIKAEIHEYVLKNYKIMKIATTKAQRKLFFNLKKAKDRLGWFNHQEVQDLARELNVSSQDVLDMESRLAVADEAFDGYTTDNDDDSVLSPADYLTEGDVANPATIVANYDTNDKSTDNMMQALDQLDDRAQDIVRSRWLSDDKATLKELAVKYGVSLERIRQIEANSFNIMRVSIDR